MPVLDRYMHAAIEAIAKAREAIPHSVNYGYTSSAIKKASGAPLFEQCDRALFKGVRNEIEVIIDRWKERPNRNDTGANRQFVEEVARAALGSNCGNCGELAFVMAHILMQSGVRGIDVIKVRPVNPEARTNTIVVPHWFVAIGRSGGPMTDNTDLGLPNTWAARAIIADAWDRTAYETHRYDEYWGKLYEAANGNELTCELWCRV